MSEVNLVSNAPNLDSSRRHRPENMARGQNTPSETYRITPDRTKFCLDFLMATTALVVLFPMLLMVMMLIYAVQGGPVFIAHRRIGRHGVVFPCFKFRTMVNNSDDVLAQHLASNRDVRAEWNATRKLKNDPRVTPLGLVLRKNSIDEIPQLFNVLRGDMSLVGPRPIVASEAEFYGPHFANYVRVRPGLTGLWQVSGRSDTSYRRRVELDVRYVSERSLWGDLVIMAKTLPAVLSSRGSY